jgi:hypothetical protein
MPDEYYTNGVYQPIGKVGLRNPLNFSDYYEDFNVNCWYYS